MNYEQLITQAEAFVSKYMRKHDNPKLLYHNLAHTQNIVSVAGQIAKQSSLNDKEFFIVVAAAWFLYVGIGWILIQQVIAQAGYVAFEFLFFVHVIVHWPYAFACYCGIK